MRRVSHFACISALVLVLLTPGSVGAANAATYHGDLLHAWWPTCGSTPAQDEAITGNWNVTLQPDGTAVVHLTLFEYDKLYTAWGGNYYHATWIQRPPATGEVFSLLLHFAPMDSDLTFVLATDGAMTFAITPFFDCPWHSMTGVAR